MFNKKIIADNELYKKLHEMTEIVAARTLLYRDNETSAEALALLLISNSAKADRIVLQMFNINYQKAKSILERADELRA